MQLSVLMENTASDERFYAEHGLSLLVKTGRHTILFDTGASGNFAKNAAAMGVDIAQADIAVLSHGHYDHGGGLARFLSENTRAKVYLSAFAFDPTYNAQGAYIGLDAELANHPRIVRVADSMTIDSELELRAGFMLPETYPVNSFGLQRKKRGELVPDDFRHEMYLVIHEQGKRVLLSGCSHRGILNIVDWIRPNVMVGGFHFMTLDPAADADRETLNEAARVLLSYDTEYYTCHCTGLAQYDALKARMGDRLHYCSAGQTIVL